MSDADGAPADDDGEGPRDFDGRLLPRAETYEKLTEDEKDTYLFGELIYLAKRVDSNCEDDKRKAYHQSIKDQQENVSTFFFLKDSPREMPKLANKDSKF